MFKLIEAQRSALEEVETIELAIADRFRRNADVIPENIGQKPGDELLKTTKKRPYKETMLQRHEVSHFQDKFRRIGERFLADKKLRIGTIRDELKKIDDPGNNLQAFNASLAEIKSRHALTNTTSPAEALKVIYAMYSSAPSEEKKVKKRKVKVKRKHTLSLAASHIDLDSIFTPNEFCGKFMDLNNLWEQYKSFTSSDISYVEYLSKFDKFDINPKTHQKYSEYLSDLAAYLENFLKKVLPTFDYRSLDGESKRDYTLTNARKTENEDGVPNEKGEVFCGPCNKLFTKKTVYDNHLTGKKHLKNQKTNPDSSHHGDLSQETGFLEFKIQTIAKHLEPYRDSTLSNAERKYALTERERMIESLDIVGDESEYTTVNDSSESESGVESSDDDENYKDLPLGVDGKPIPFWLYKLQGLHQSYNCEICGNVSYKGRSLFSKHFSTLKHQQGLKFLGVTDEFVPLFKNIVSIDEAVELWQRLKKEKRLKEGEIENSVEVEDKDGNVMSEKDYIDLKKQGLL